MPSKLDIQAKGLSKAQVVASLKSWIDGLEVQAKNRHNGLEHPDYHLHLGFDPDFNYEWHLHREVRVWWPEGIKDG